jgi:hypothetical protein
MDIYSILASKPHNPHYLKRYITFIEKCQQKNVGYKGPVENHHICPKADDMFPEYIDFRLHPWNKAPLTTRQHFIAHLILWKVYPLFNSQTIASWLMKNTRSGIKVNSRLYESLKNDFRKMNSKLHKDLVTVKDNDGKYFKVSKDDVRYLSGDLIHIRTGQVVVKDENGNTFSVSVDDSRYLLGELISHAIGMTPVKDKDGNTQKVSVDDPRLKTGDLVHVRDGLVTVKDKDGNTFSVSVDDPRLEGGDLVHLRTGQTVVKDKDGNTFSVSVNDPRYLSGELTGMMSGTVTVKDKEGNNYRVLKDDPRYLSGELVGAQKGRISINNGTKNKFIDANSPIPEGWFRGMIKKSNKMKLNP